MKKVILIIFLITFPHSAETAQLPPRMTRMTNTISILKILQLFYWKAPVSPPFWKGNHKHTYHPVWVMCTTSAKLRPQKFVLLDGSVELLEFTSCTPQGSCCSELSRCHQGAKQEFGCRHSSGAGGQPGPTGRKCAQSTPSVDAAIRGRKAEEATSLERVKRNRGGGKSRAGDRGEFRKFKKKKN